MTLVYRLVGITWLVMLATSPLAGQELQGGIKAGAAFSSLSNVHAVTDNDDDSSGVYTGATVGAYAAYPLTERLAIQPEVFYVTKGAALDDDADGNRRSVAIHYLEIPVLLKLSAPPGNRLGMYAFAGGTIGVKLDAQLMEGDDEEDLGDDIRRADIGATVGLGVQGARWLVEGRFTQGFLDVGDEADAVRTRTVAVLAGVRF